ncbi:Na/Pi symporter [Paraburkholderia sp. Ac-20340]|uniref:Na/Pi symporter n=1 Tax=Paraburkholderia sp. Ac-20340 TaxID=2703888 RepID=UPI001F119EA6|nr:Na/Pi symporter [Paraburkholderia sp. Ac-20340]
MSFDDDSDKRARMKNLIDALGVLIGGIGLFLLGITMMTNGLKLAAGPALELILRRATRTPLAGLASGVLVTALVQSSTAVTMAVIGFVNAGLLDLGGALWVLFGANLGMTTTGWIVSLLGLKMKIDALALPMVGIGIALRLTISTLPWSWCPNWPSMRYATRCSALARWCGACCA